MPVLRYNFILENDTNFTVSFFFNFAAYNVYVYTSSVIKVIFHLEIGDIEK